MSQPRVSDDDVASQGRISDDDDAKKLRGADNWSRGTFWCLVFMGAMLIISVCLVINNSKPNGATFMQSSPKLPVPPQPYEYSTFMAWLELEQKDFAHVSGWKWKPDVAEFDLDAPASKGKFAKYLSQPDGQEAITAAKHINKFIFMGDSMQTGDLNHVGGPGTHLYVLQKLAVATAAKGLTQPTFLDAGCGPGYLLEAWTVICGPGSRAIGIDIDKDTVQNAKRYLADPNILDASVSKEQTAGATTLVQVGDAMKPKVSSLKAGTVDAVNVGLAVKSLSDLDTLSDFLRPDGLMLAPICLSDADQPEDVPAGKCQALLKTFKKGSDGELVRMPGDPDIPCRFVVSEAKPLTNMRR